MISSISKHIHILPHRDVQNIIITPWIALGLCSCVHGEHGLVKQFIYRHVSNQSKDDSVLNLHGVGPIFTLINLTDNWLKEYFMYMQLSAVSSCSH